MTINAEQAIDRALRLIDRAMADMPTVGQLATIGRGTPVLRLPDFSEGAVLARSARARALMVDIDALDHRLLPPSIAATLSVARVNAYRWSHEGDWYWLVLDPLRVGFFGMFAPTAYCGGFFLNTLLPLFTGYQFQEQGDVDRYLGLIADFARVVRQFDERTIGQAERGIRMPVAQLDQTITLVRKQMVSLSATLHVDHARLAEHGGAATAALIGDRIASSVEPAFAALLATLEHPDYRRAAPQMVGLAQYPGGSEVYTELVKLSLSLDMAVAEVHAAGHARIARIRGEMQTLFDAIGFEGDAHAYVAELAEQPQWRAEGAEAIGALFRRYIDRIAPHIDAHFNFRPSADHDVAPLPAAMSAAMTFGYYAPPTEHEPIGKFIYNADNLGRGALNNVAALNYHELVPGHHFHIASQRENIDLHPLRQESSFNAFNEGWAEYAATLAGEWGMYATPEEKFGRMMMDSFLSCRLVVDTGMNALGWSLERARDYMRANSFMPETEICSETIRYSCDVPAQALAYKLGDAFLLEQRERMQSALGDRFDIRDFHDAVLIPGGLPLPMVAANVEAATQRLLAKAG